MKDKFVKRYNENLVKAVKADLNGRTRDADYLFGMVNTASSFLTMLFTLVNLNALRECMLISQYD